MVIQQQLKDQDPPVHYHDENGRPVEKDFLLSVADCSKFIQLMFTSFSDVLDMEKESVVISKFKDVVATGRGKCDRARQHVTPIAKIYLETYQPHLVDIQESRRNMVYVSVSESSESDQDVEGIAHNNTHSHSFK